MFCGAFRMQMRFLPTHLNRSSETRFSESIEIDLYQQMSNGPSLVSLSLVQITVNIPFNSHSKLAASIKRMEEHILEYMQTCLSKFGLWCWCPTFVNRHTASITWPAESLLSTLLNKLSSPICTCTSTPTFRTPRTSHFLCDFMITLPITTSTPGEVLATEVG
jgi:hypothetical protein